MDSEPAEPLRLPTLSAVLGTALLAVGAVVVLTWLLVVVAPWVAVGRDGPDAVEPPIGLLVGSVVALVILSACTAAAVLLWPLDHRTRQAQRRGCVVAVLLSVGGVVMGASGLLGSYAMVFPSFYAGVVIVSLLLLAAAVAIGWAEPQRSAVAPAP